MADDWTVRPIGRATDEFTNALYLIEIATIEARERFRHELKSTLPEREQWQLWAHPDGGGVVHSISVLSNLLEWLNL